MALFVLLDGNQAVVDFINTLQENADNLADELSMTALDISSGTMMVGYGYIWDGETFTPPEQPYESEVLASETLELQKIEFGKQVITRYAAMNEREGIDVSTAVQIATLLAPLISLLSVGALEASIAFMKALPPEDFIPVYLTDPKLLWFINETEQFLGLPLSEVRQ